MAHNQPPEQSIDVKSAYVSEQTVLAVRLDSEADRCEDPDDALRLHATADLARALADIETKLGDMRADAPEPRREPT